MGDDAWLWQLECQSRAFNFMGDTTICSGEVVDKRVEGTHRVVELKLAGTNQRGEISAPGRAVVIQPSRADGAIKLPQPPAERLERAARIIPGA
jgi:hypothetical protein